jgi:hypothetical protein
MARTMNESAAITYAAPGDAPRAYRPAGFSRFLAWVAGLPGHGWWVFPALALLLVAWSHGILWGTGRLPVGTFDPVVGWGAAYAPYTLAALAYLNRVALGALRSFWPAMGRPESERPAWAYAFTTSPAGSGLVIVGLGLVLATASFLTAPSAILPSDTTARAILFVAYLPTLFSGYALVVVAGIHTLRQLRLVSRIHRQATAIDPWDRVSLYAFSRLTVQTGLAYILVGYFALTVNGSWQAGNVVSMLTIVATFTIGTAAFVVPLWGIHGRLVREKELLVRSADARLERLAAEMYGRVDAGEFDRTKVIADALDGVRGIRERIGRLPTWPWPPEVLRGFVSALFLPVLVYVVSRLISSGFGA